MTKENHMIKKLSVIIFVLTISTSYSQLDSLKYHGDIEFSKANYTRAVENYKKSGRSNLSTKQLGRLLYCEYQCNQLDRKSTRLNSSHVRISYAVFCLKKKKRY